MGWRVGGWVEDGLITAGHWRSAGHSHRCNHCAFLARLLRGGCALPGLTGVWLSMSAGVAEAEHARRATDVGVLRSLRCCQGDCKARLRLRRYLPHHAHTHTVQQHFGITVHHLTHYSTIELPLRRRPCAPVSPPPRTEPNPCLTARLRARAACRCSRRAIGVLHGSSHRPLRRRPGGGGPSQPPSCVRASPGASCRPPSPTQSGRKEG